MVVADRRRRRQRGGRLVLTALLLTALVVVWNAVASTSEGGPDPVVAYLDSVRPLTEDSARQGADLADLRDRGPAVGRDGLRRRVDRLVAQTAATAEAVEALEVRDEDRRRHGLLLTALLTRAKAMKDLQGALVVGLAAERPADEAGRALAAVGDQLVVADAAYRLFVEEVPRGTRPRMPEAIWVPDPVAWQPAESAAYVAALRAAETLAPVHDLRMLTFTTDPSSVPSPSASVLPGTRSLRVHAVVANVGNTAERRVPVEAVLTAHTGAVDSARVFVDLAPGERVTVQVGGLTTTPGGVSTLEVRVGPVAGEATPDDNVVARSYDVRDS